MSSESGGKYQFVQNYPSDKIKIGECELTGNISGDPWIKGSYDTICDCCEDNFSNLDKNGLGECRSQGCSLPKPTMSPAPRTSTPAPRTSTPVPRTSTPVPRTTSSPQKTFPPDKNKPIDVSSEKCEESTKKYSNVTMCNNDYTKTIIAMSCLLLVLILLQLASRHFIFPILQFSAALIVLILSALQL